MASLLLTTTAVHRNLSCVFSLRVCAAAILVAALFWRMSPVRAADSGVQTIIAQLAKSANPDPTDTGERPAPSAYEAMYWLAMAARADVSPEGAILLAVKLGDPSQAYPVQQQLLADWHMVSVYGLATPDNLLRLRNRVPPTATDGRFAGLILEEVKIHPDAPPSLQNFAFCPRGQPLPSEAVGYQPPPRSEAIKGAYQPRPKPVWTTPSLLTSDELFVRTSTRTLTTREVNRGGHFEEPLILPTIPLGWRIPPEEFSIEPAQPSGVTIKQLPEGTKLYTIPFNGGIFVRGKAKLAVASNRDKEVSVSVINAGPMALAVGGHGGYVYVERVDNSKVPKVNPVQLPGVSEPAYLILTCGNSRYYFIDNPFNNDGSFLVGETLLP